jgi:hypothetical protein
MPENKSFHLGRQGKKYSLVVGFVVFLLGHFHCTVPWQKFKKKFFNAMQMSDHM